MIAPYRIFPTKKVVCACIVSFSLALLMLVTIDRARAQDIVPSLHVSEPTVDDKLQVTATISATDTVSLRDCLYELVAGNMSADSAFSVWEDHQRINNLTVRSHRKHQLAFVYAPSANFDTYPLFQQMLLGIIQQRILCQTWDRIAAFVPIAEPKGFQSIFAADGDPFSESFNEIYNSTIAYGPKDFAAIDIYLGTTALLKTLPPCKEDTVCQFIILSDGAFANDPNKDRDLINEAAAQYYEIYTILLGQEDETRKQVLQLSDNQYLGAISNEATIPETVKNAWRALLSERSSVTIDYPLAAAHPLQLTIEYSGTRDEKPFPDLPLSPPILEISTDQTITRTIFANELGTQTFPLTTTLWLRVTWPDGKPREITQGVYEFNGQSAALAGSPFVLSLAGLNVDSYTLNVTVYDRLNLSTTANSEISIVDLAPTRNDSQWADQFTERSRGFWQRFPAPIRTINELAINRRKLFIFVTLLLPLFCIGTLIGGLDWWRNWNRVSQEDTTETDPLSGINTGVSTSATNIAGAPQYNQSTYQQAAMEGTKIPSLPPAWQRAPMAYLVPVNRNAGELFRPVNDYTRECLQKGKIPLYHPAVPDRSPAYIGTEPDKGANVILNAGFNISRLHAKIEWARDVSSQFGEKFHIRDEGSTNGTYVLSQLSPTSSRIPARLSAQDNLPLSHGDKVIFFEVEFRFEDKDEGTVTEYVSPSHSLNKPSIQLNQQPLAMTQMSSIWRAVLTVGASTRTIIVKRSLDIDKNEIVANEEHWLKRIHEQQSLDGVIQLVPYESNFDHDNLRFLVLEYIEGGTLKALVTNTSGLELSLAVQIAIQLTKVVEFIHSKACVHLDLHPSNVMFRQKPDLSTGLRNTTVVLIDFGIADASGDVYRRGGTEVWLSPERNKEHLDATSQNLLAPSKLVVHPSMDIYSMGQIIFFMLTNKDPEHNQMIEWLQNAERTERLAPLKNLCHLVKEMIDDEPQRRPTASRLVQQLQTIKKSIL